MTPHVNQLFSLLMGQGDFPRLADAVVRAEAKMTEAGERDLWLFWRAHSLLLLGNLDQAREYLSLIKDEERAEALDLLLKRDIAERDNNLEPLITTLEQRYAKSADPLHLFELCDAYQSAQRWHEVASHSKMLVDQVKTVAALALAVEAAQRTSNPSLCLELLTEREALFPDNVFPVSFRRARVQALVQLGSPERALAETEEIARETDDSRDIMNVVAVRLQCADPKGAVVAARKLLNRDDVSAESHLRLATSLKIEDNAAATAHLERALAKKNDSPQFVAGAMDLSFRLNQEDKLAELQPSVFKAASSGGPIVMAGPDKIVEVLREQNERRESTETLYAGGRIPIHLALEFVGGTVAGIYHSRFQLFDSNDWPPAPPLYILHGGRAATPVPRAINRLHVDVSSLLLASELGILDLVERAFSPLFLPHSIVTLLYRQLEAASPHQPSKLDEARIIFSLLNAKVISVAPHAIEKEEASLNNRPSAQWLALVDVVRKSGGVVVDYLPVTSGFPPRAVELSGDEPQLVVGISSVLQTLEQAAVITAEGSNFARRKLHSLANGEARSLPKGTPLLVRGNIAEVLAGAGLLEAAAKYFHVSIETDEEQRVKGTLRYEERNEQLRASLRRLLDRLQKGMGTNWCLLPQVPLDDVVSAHGESTCLAELMKAAESATDGQVWVDDRYLNGFATCGRLPIVTMRDVLSELLARGFLEPSAYFSLLHRLRSANLRYIPLKSEEIIHYLSRAHVRNGEVVETVELATLRRYTAACFLDRGKIQLPPVAEGLPNPEGEIALLPSSLAATREALTAIWSKVSTENVSEVKARADWLLHSVWCDAASLSWIVGSRANVPKELHGSALAQLYVQGLGMPGNRRKTDPNSPSPRSLYFNWLASRVAHDPESLDGAGKHLADIFTKENWSRPSADQGLINALLGEFLHDLPSNVNKALSLSKKTLQRLGIEYIDSITIDKHSFDSQTFWPSAEQAVQGKSVRVQAQDTAAVFALTFTQTDQGPTLILVQEGGDARLAMASPSFALLDRDRQKRRQILRTHWEWFDCERTQFDQETKRIANNADANERFHKMERWKQRSSENYYRNLSEARVAQRALKLTDFSPPSSYGLLSHLRLSESPGPHPVGEIMRKSAADLMRDLGFEETFCRLSTLPASMPDTVQEAFRALAPKVRSEWIARARTEFQSPISFLHLISLVSQTEPSVALELLEEKVLGDALKEFEAFQLIHYWTLSQLELRAEVNRWPARIRLALTWLHASRLFNILIRASNPEIICEYFAAAIRPTSHDVFDLDREFEREAVHPRQLRFRSFYVHAILTMLRVTNWSSSESDHFRRVLRRLCFLDEERNMPHPDLLFPAEWLRNSFGSFVAGERSSFLREWLKDDATVFSTEFTIGFLGDHLRRLSEWQSSELTSWTVLHSIVGVNCLPESLHSKAVELATDHRLVALVSKDAAVRKPALWFLVHQCAQSHQIRANFSDQLVNISRELAGKGLSGEELQETVTVIVESAHVVATGESTPQQASEAFSNLLIRVLDVWPGSVDEFWTTLRGLTARLSPSIAVGLWPLMLELRKRTRVGIRHETVAESPSG